MKVRDLIPSLLFANVITFAILCWVIAYQNPGMNDVWVFLVAIGRLLP
jgi:hypothetical protein